jgi:hypothetical protein
MVWPAAAVKAARRLGEKFHPGLVGRRFYPTSPQPVDFPWSSAVHLVVGGQSAATLKLRVGQAVDAVVTVGDFFECRALSVFAS